jgi:hypothetical protein
MKDAVRNMILLKLDRSGTGSVQYQDENGTQVRWATWIPMSKGSSECYDLASSQAEGETSPRGCNHIQ